MSGYPLEQLEPAPESSPPGTPERLVAEARAEAEQVREQARAEGYAAGWDEGREAGIEQARHGARALDEALAALREQSDELLLERERDAVELALELAAKIVSGALEVQPERVLDVVAGALRRLADRGRVVVLVDPADLEFVSERVEELKSRAGGVERWELQADRRVGRGGAIVRSRERQVDASVATQLERARELVSSELGGS